MGSSWPGHLFYLLFVRSLSPAQSAARSSVRLLIRSPARPSVRPFLDVCLNLSQADCQIRKQPPRCQLLPLISCANNL